MTTTATSTNPFPHIPMPAGADGVDSWADIETGNAFRCFFGPSRRVPHEQAESFTDVLIQGSQSSDGSIDERGISVYIGTDTPLSSNEARAIAAAMVAAADDVDKWAAR